MYTVIDTNLHTHIYKVVDDKGNTKVVHRNLLLDISFLPVETPKDDSRESQSDGAVDPEYEGQSMDLSGFDEEESSGDMTSSWILSGVDDPANQDSSERQETVRDEMEQEQSAYSCRDNPNQDRQAQLSLNNETAISIPDHDRVAVVPDTEPSGIPDSIAPTDLASDQDLQRPGSRDSQDVVRTRTGRVVKSVSRLIETMAQKPFTMEGLATKLGK